MVLWRSVGAAGSICLESACCMGIFSSVAGGMYPFRNFNGSIPSKEVDASAGTRCTIMEGAYETKNDTANSISFCV